MRTRPPRSRKSFSPARGSFYLRRPSRQRNELIFCARRANERIARRATMQILRHRSTRSVFNSSLEKQPREFVCYPPECTWQNKIGTRVTFPSACRARTYARNVHAKLPTLKYQICARHDDSMAFKFYAQTDSVGRAACVQRENAFSIFRSIRLLSGCCYRSNVLTLRCIVPTDSTLVVF
jgi:hypothetical protein